MGALFLIQPGQSPLMVLKHYMLIYYTPIYIAIIHYSLLQNIWNVYCWYPVFIKSRFILKYLNQLIIKSTLLSWRNINLININHENEIAQGLKRSEKLHNRTTMLDSANQIFLYFYPRTYTSQFTTVNELAFNLTK